MLRLCFVVNVVFQRMHASKYPSSTKLGTRGQTIQPRKDNTYVDGMLLDHLVPGCVRRRWGSPASHCLHEHPINIYTRMDGGSTCHRHLRLSASGSYSTFMRCSSVGGNDWTVVQRFMHARGRQHAWVHHRAAHGQSRHEDIPCTWG